MLFPHIRSLGVAHLVVIGCAMATGAPSCPGKNFAYNASGDQILGLSRNDGATSADACAAACCTDGPCEVWQFQPGNSHSNGCWLGRMSQRGSSGNWVGASTSSGPPPPPPPPQPAPPGAPIAVNDIKSLGLQWEGVGAISGGGATTKLLMDYDPKVSSDILDYLFLPNFGLNLQLLKVEVGGDADATEGAEPSHMHYAGDENYNRGYEWWLMKEAKARNPNIKLYGLPWAFAGWLDPSAGPDTPAKNAFANPNISANYTVSWLEGANRVHGLNIDYIGQWNERNAPADYAAALREAVSARSPETFVLNRLPHYPGTGSVADPQGCTQYQWNTTDGSRWVDEEGSVADGKSARCLARCVSRNYVTGCHTATFQWHLISSFYDYLPWSRCGVAVANTPWSGSYEVTSPTWALAHTSQFAPPGWRYTGHGAGVQLLSAGGSIVTRVSPDRSDFSIVLEKMTHQDSSCARGSNPSYDTSPENVTMVLGGRLLTAAQNGLQVWFSDLSQGNDSPSLFVNKGSISVGSDGKIVLPLGLNQMYTVTTLKTGNKGNHSVPTAAPFPIPYTQHFDDENVSSPPRLWYDQMGAWEIRPSSTGSGNVMRQMVPIWPACWGYSCNGPTTYFGPGGVIQAGMNVSFTIVLEDDAELSTSYCTIDSKTGAWTIGKAKGSGAVFPPKASHTISIALRSDSTTVILDGKVLGSGEAIVGGSSGGFKLALNRYVFAEIDNFAITNLSNEY